MNISSKDFSLLDLSPNEEEMMIKVMRVLHDQPTMTYEVCAKKEVER